MRILSALKNESGYTLVESIVSMTLLVGVLVPLGATVGNLVLSDDSDIMYHALRVAQTEVCSPVSLGRLAARANFIVDGLPVTKTIVMNGDLVTVIVTVTSPKDADKNLVTLQKSFLVYNR